MVLGCGDSDAFVVDASVDSNKDVVTDGPPQIDAPPGCDLKADPKDSPACVDGSVGVFVDSAGKDSNDGSKANPVATLKAAFLLASQKGLPRVYVCEGNYSESATMSSSISIYGGFKCGTWSYTGSKPKFAGTKSDYVLKLDGVNGVTVEDMEFDAKDGSMPGESSIAMFVNASMGVQLTRDALNGGGGIAGAPGSLTNYTFPSQQKLNGNASPDGGAGGPANMETCPDGQTTTGGKGGDIYNKNGDNGLPMQGGGAGGTAVDCLGQNTGGKNGSAGSAGAPAAAGTAYGQLGSVWAPSNGLDGKSGGPGQGGGGGGSTTGAGGGGGAGGCGGAGGGGGGGGGSSLGLVSVLSGLKMTSCTISTKNGGSGGSGASGQNGQSPGGFGGNPGPGGCLGGAGGAGGNGGGGAGGAGGLSVGILYKGTAVDADNSSQMSIAVASKGSGGMGAASNNGLDGVAQPILECKSPLCN